MSIKDVEERIAQLERTVDRLLEVAEFDSKALNIIKEQMVKLTEVVDKFVDAMDHRSR